MRIVIALATLLAFSSPLAAQTTCDLHCGTERWAIKTLSDPGASQVDTTPTAATVKQLRALRVPASIPRRRGKPQLPAADRIAPVELTTYRVEALLLGWKLESDEDFHLVIASPANRTQTMIAEVPSPTCPEICRTGNAVLFASLRQRLIAQLGQPKSRYVRLPQALPITITGVGFFDFAHGQTGVAPNAIELHPVLAIAFH
ncbi:MAG: hypothetical protein ABSG61_14135 [Gemmatimonadales bacterium]|jgi:hypothetical protein